MKAAIFNPYWDTLGGGERYSISFAKALTELGYTVDIEWVDDSLLSKITSRFGISINNVNIVKSVNKGDGYDICFWVSDGSIPLLHARNNFLHFQVPFTNVNGGTLINRMKMIRIKKVICNSNFTKKVIDREFNVRSIVLYPPCDTEKIKPKRKENKVLYVGRFSELLQSKRQDVLVDAFKKVVDGGNHDWKLILAGGVDVGVGGYLKSLKKKAGGYAIEFIESPAYSQLVDLYSKCKIFWSASGYGEDHNKHPEKVEHFGISLVEAMAGGCVPFVYNGGGYPEILEGSSELLWSKRSSLVRKTSELIRNNKEVRRISKAMIERSKNFSYEKFKNSVRSFI